MYARIQIHGRTLDSLIDTGANICVVKRSMYQEIVQSARPKLERTGEDLVMADDRSIPLFGCGNFSLKMGDFSASHPVWVADISTDFILGCDFLAKYKCQIDLGLGQIKIGNIVVQCFGNERLNAPSNVVNRITVAETVCISPGQEIVVPGKLANKLDGTEFIVEPCESFVKKHSIMVAKAVVNPQSHVVPIRMINVDSVPVTVYEGVTAATCEPVEEVLSVQNTEGDTSNEGGGVTDLPQHILGLYNSLEGSLDENQKALVRRLLLKHESIFAKCKEDLGRTDIVKHKIPTKEVSPIKQHARRLPLNKREDAANEVSDMLRRGSLNLQQCFRRVIMN